MQFSTRNAFYLRASNYRVIPLFLYLDERHVDWMTDRVLQLVISQLQPKMHDLLLSAKAAKKHKVHVERGEGYQYCYFLRTTTRTEVVLLKQKTYNLRPPTPPPVKRSASSSATPDKRQRRSRTRSRSISVRAETDESELQVKTEPVELDEPDSFVAKDTLGEKGIKDWKPDVDVTFKGFGTSSVQLVLIVEPYPPLLSSQYAPPSSRLSSRSASIASSRSRTRAGTGRYSSTSLSVALDGGGRSQTVSAPNMRNATRSISATPAPNSRRGGGSVTPFIGDGRENSATPGPGGATGRRRRTSQTPLFMPRDTPFGEDDEDEEAHEEYTAALREGRARLPSVSGGRDGEEDDEGDDIPESIMDMSQRLVRSSEIEEGIVRVMGGWEERAEGEDSAVMGKEEPGD